jgi:hypothetical protein
MALSDQTQRLLEILDRGRDLLNEPDEEERPREKSTRFLRLSSPRDPLEETDRPDIAAYLGSSVQTERLAEAEERFEESQRDDRFDLKPLEPYVEHATAGLEVELGKIQLRMQELQAQLNPENALSDPFEPFALPMTLEDLGMTVEQKQPVRVHRSAIPLPKPADSDPNDYSVSEMERLKWQIMEEKRIQERLSRENAKLDNRVNHRIDLEARLQTMKEMVNQLRVSVDHSKHLRKRQKGLVKVLQYQLDRKTLSSLEEKFPAYIPALPLPKRKKKRTNRPIIQHGRIVARRPSA